MTRRAMILQHMSDDNLDRFGEWLTSDGFTIDTVHIYDGQHVPDLAGYDLMMVMGGAMEVWDEDKCPWLVAEKEAIREWVGVRAKPYIGICLGHQLLADALGGQVESAAHKEVGLCEVTYLDNAHSFSEGLSGPRKVMQWHHSHVVEAPDGAEVLASSDTTDVQVLAVGEHALGVQFHFEWTVAGIRAWDGGWLTALDRDLGVGQHPRVIREAEEHMPDIEEMTGLLYGNFKRVNGL